MGGCIGGHGSLAVAVSMAPAAKPPKRQPPIGAGRNPAYADGHPAGSGNPRITFREATDPAGLQRTLRADGVPASVTFTGQQNRASPCRKRKPGAAV